MKAKDTIMSDKEITRIRVITTQDEYLCEKQAEITWHARDVEVRDSFKAGQQEGRKEVIDWINTNNIKLMEPARMGGYQNVRKEKWQAKLKEWSIKAEM